VWDLYFTINIYEKKRGFISSYLIAPNNGFHHDIFIHAHKALGSYSQPSIYLKKKKKGGRFELGTGGSFR
jgi:hypothetical protein